MLPLFLILILTSTVCSDVTGGDPAISDFGPAQELDDQSDSPFLIETSSEYSGLLDALADVCESKISTSSKRDRPSFVFPKQRTKILNRDYLYVYVPEYAETSTLQLIGLPSDVVDEDYSSAARAYHCSPQHGQLVCDLNHVLAHDEISNISPNNVLCLMDTSSTHATLAPQASSEAAFIGLAALLWIVVGVSAIGDLVILVGTIARCCQIGCGKSMKRCGCACCRYGLFITVCWMLPCCWRKAFCLEGDFGIEENVDVDVELEGGEKQSNDDEGNSEEPTPTKPEKKEKKKRIRPIPRDEPLVMGWVFLLLLGFQIVFALLIPFDLFLIEQIPNIALVLLEAIGVVIGFFDGIKTGCCVRPKHAPDLQDWALARSPLSIANQWLSSVGSFVVFFFVLASLFLDVLDTMYFIVGIPVAAFFMQFGNALVETILALMDWSVDDDEAFDEDFDRPCCKCGFELQRWFDKCVGIPGSIVSVAVGLVLTVLIVVSIFAVNIVYIQQGAEFSTGLEATQYMILAVPLFGQLIGMLVLGCFGAPRPFFCWKEEQKCSIRRSACLIGAGYRVFEILVVLFAMTFAVVYSFVSFGVSVNVNTVGAIVLAFTGIGFLFQICFFGTMLASSCVFCRAVREESRDIRRASAVQNLGEALEEEVEWETPAEGEDGKTDALTGDDAIEKEEDGDEEKGDADEERGDEEDFGESSGDDERSSDD